MISDYENYMFDLYGTLIDIRTDEKAAQTWKKWLKCLDKRKIKHPSYILMRDDFFKRDKKAREDALATGEFEYPEIDVIPIYREMFKSYGNRDLSTEELNEISYEFRLSSRLYIKLYPDVDNFLVKLKECGKHPYILSNAQASYTEPEIKMFHLDELVDGYLMSSDFLCMKPDHRFYDILINKYNLDKSKTVMFGDSRKNDYEGAISAGLSAVHLAGENRSAVFYTREIKNL